MRPAIIRNPDGYTVEGEHFVSRLAAVEHAAYLEQLRSGDPYEVTELTLDRAAEQLRLKLFTARSQR